VTELRDSTESFISRLNHAENRINGLEDKTFAIIHSKEKTEKII